MGPFRSIVPYIMSLRFEQLPLSGGVVGVVIAGGRSVRFGGEKAVAGLAGKPLLMWAAERLARSCVTVAINARPDTEAEALARAEGLTVLHDMPRVIRPRPALRGKGHRPTVSRKSWVPALSR